MDIKKEREALIVEIERFKAEALKMYFIETWSESYKTDPFSYAIDDENKIIWMKAQARQLWDFWQQAQKVAVVEWNNYETKSPRIDGRYLIFVGGEQLCADFSVGFGFSSAEDGTAFIQELITHWAVPCDDPIEAQEQAL